MSVHNGLVCVCSLMALQGGILATASCSYWYSLVPSPVLECDPLGVDTSLACEVYVPHDPPTTVKWYKSEFPQNDTRIIAISHNTDKYDLNTIPLSNGAFSGLFYDLYLLKIINFTASDTGYYWCQIETNSTEDSLTLQPSQYGYLALNPGQRKCSPGLLYLENLTSAVCAVQSFNTAILTSIVTSSSIFSTITMPAASSVMLPSSILTPLDNTLSTNLPHASISDDTVLSPSPMSSKLYSLPLRKTSELNSAHCHNSKVARATPSPRSAPTVKSVNMFAIIGVMGGVILLLICVVGVIFPCIIICQFKEKRRQLWKGRTQEQPMNMLEHSLHVLPPPGPNANIIYAEIIDHSATLADLPTPAAGNEDGYVSPEVIRERKTHSIEQDVSTTAPPHYQPLITTNREYAQVYTMPKKE